MADTVVDQRVIETDAPEIAGLRFRHWRDERDFAALYAVAATHPPDVPKVFSSEAESREVGAAALLHAEGYSAVRHFFHMERHGLDGIPDLPLPDGIEVRPVLPTHYRAIFDAEDEAFRD